MNILIIWQHFMPSVMPLTKNKKKSIVLNFALTTQSQDRYRNILNSVNFPCDKLCFCKQGSDNFPHINISPKKKYCYNLTFHISSSAQREV
jgi:hypothetical protein